MENQQIQKQEKFIAKFRSSFKSDDSPDHLEFYRGSMRQALVAAFTGSGRNQEIQVRPVVVYLHNDNNPSSHTFCQEVLCDPEVINKLKSVDSLVLGYDTTDPEVCKMFGEIFTANSVSMERWIESCRSDIPLLYIIGVCSNKSKSSFKYRVVSASYGQWATVITVLEDLEDFVDNHLGDKTLLSGRDLSLLKWCQRFGIDSRPPFSCKYFTFTLMRTSIFGIKGDTLRYKCCLLAVFLHNSLSPMTYDVYTALCDPEIVAILDKNFLLFTRDLTLEENHDHFWRMTRHFKMISENKIAHAKMNPLMIVLRKTRDSKVDSVTLPADILISKKKLKEVLVKEVDLCRSEGVWRKVECPEQMPDPLPRVYTIDEMRATIPPKPSKISIRNLLDEHRSLEDDEKDSKPIGDRLIIQDSAVTSTIMCHYYIPFKSYFPQWIVDNRRKVTKKPELPFYRNIVLVATGSKEECLSLPSVGLNKPIVGNTTAQLLDRRADMDYMLVVSCCQINITQHTESHLVVDTNHTRRGFVRLKHVRPLTAACAKHSGNIGTFVKTNDGSIYYTVYRDKQRIKSVLAGTEKNVAQHGPAVTHWTGNIEFDWTLAVRLHEWPIQEWVTRDRPSGWPSKETIQEVIGYGCHLVQVAHTSSTMPEIEWRMSFTVAERILALSLTSHQRAHYIFFKTIISFVCNGCSVVSSYCLKNILFWVIEILPPSIWNQNVEDSGVLFSILLDRLIHCLTQQHLPSYFVREQNLIEHKPRDAIQSMTRRLVKLRRQACIPLYHRILVPGGSLVSVSGALVMISTVSNTIDLNMPVEVFDDVHGELMRTRLMMFAFSGKEKQSGLYIEERQRLLSTNPEIVMEYETRPGAFADLIKKLDLKDPEQYLLGFAWCYFVSTVHRNGSLSHEQTQLIEDTFKMSIEWMKNASSKNIHEVNFYRAIFLMKTGRRDEAESTVRSLLNDVILDKTYVPEDHWKVFICHIDDCVLDDTLADVLNQQDDLPFALFDFVSLLYHLLFISRNRDVLVLNTFRTYVCGRGRWSTKYMASYLSSIQLLQADLRSVGIHGKLDALMEHDINKNLSKNSLLNFRQKEFMLFISSLMTDMTGNELILQNTKLI